MWIVDSIYDDCVRWHSCPVERISRTALPSPPDRSPVALLICISAVVHPSILTSVYAFLPTLPRELPRARPEYTSPAPNGGLTTPPARQPANIRRVHESCCSPRSWMRHYKGGFY